MNTSDGHGDAPTLTRESFFPTLVYYSDLPDSVALNAKIKTDIYRWRDDDPNGIVRSNMNRMGSWHSGLDMARRAEYRDLVDHILVAARLIFENLGYDAGSEPYIDNMWANINPRHGFNRAHVHPNVLWSGVYYVQSDKDSGRILFTDPRTQAVVFTPQYRAGPRTPELWSEVYYEPIEGRLILFPAWLLHEVEPNLSEREGRAGDRISVAFNIGQRFR